MIDQNSEEPISDAADDGDEYRLAPVVASPTIYKDKLVEPTASRPPGNRVSKSTRYRRNPHASLYAVEVSPSRPADSSSPSAQAASPSSQLADDSSANRNYSTITSLQKFLRRFGYATVAVGTFVLMFRFANHVFFFGEETTSAFSDVFLQAFWISLGTAFVSATFFAGSELFQLLLDVQSDTFSDPSRLFSYSIPEPDDFRAE